MDTAAAERARAQATLDAEIGRSFDALQLAMEEVARAAQQADESARTNGAEAERGATRVADDSLTQGINDAETGSIGVTEKPANDEAQTVPQVSAMTDQPEARAAEPSSGKTATRSSESESMHVVSSHHAVEPQARKVDQAQASAMAAALERSNSQAARAHRYAESAALIPSTWLVPSAVGIAGA
ncbi:MAG: hypothetical protein AAFO62_03020, partial [Pseudomonadota bacterium]